MPPAPSPTPTPATTTYNDGLISKELAQLGFSDVDSSINYRIVAATTAPEKAGKTHWAFTAPGPIGAIATDTGTEAVAKKFLDSKRVILCNFAGTKELLESENKAEQKKEWTRQKDAFKRLVDTKKIKTIVWDTHTEGWELCRLAAFGKLAQVMPQHYSEVNSEMTALVKMAYQRTDLNVIFINKQKKQYKTGTNGKDAWSGKWERAGFGDLPYLVDINLQHYFNRETKEFGIEVLDSRIEMVSVVGSQLEGVLCTFEELAYQLFPDTMGTDRWQ